MSEAINIKGKRTIFLGLGGTRIWTDASKDIYVFDPITNTDTLAIPLQWQIPTARVLVVDNELMAFAGYHSPQICYALEPFDKNENYVFFTVKTKLEAETARKAVEIAIAKDDAVPELTDA